MTDQMLLNRGTIFAASEDTYNTDAVGAIIAANGALTAITGYDDVDHAMVYSNYVPPEFLSSAGGVEHHVYEDHASVTGTFPIRAGLGANNLPAISHLFEGANFKVTSAAGISTFELMTRAQRAYSEYHYLQNSEGLSQQLAVATGIRNNLVFSLTMGQEPTVQRSGLSASLNELKAYAGFLADQTLVPLKNAAGTDISFSGTVVRDAGLPLKCAGMVFTVGGEAYPIESCTLDLAWDVVAVKMATADPLTSGVKLLRAASARPNGGFVLKDGADALEDAKARWAAGGKAALQAVVANATKKLTVDLLQVQLGYATKQQQAGLLAHQVPYFCVRAPEATSRAGDLAVKFAFANV